MGGNLAGRLLDLGGTLQLVASVALAAALLAGLGFREGRRG